MVGDIPFVACVTSDRDVAALGGWCGCVCTHMRSSGVRECSWLCQILPSLVFYQSLGDGEGTVHAKHRLHNARKEQGASLLLQVYLEPFAVAVLWPCLVTGNQRCQWGFPGDGVSLPMSVQLSGKNPIKFPRMSCRWSVRACPPPRNGGSPLERLCKCCHGSPCAQGEEETLVPCAISPLVHELM